MNLKSIICMNKFCIYLSLFLIMNLLGSCGDENDPSQDDGAVALVDVAGELGKNADYSLFAVALANADAANEAGSYTIFALPDSIITLDDAAMPATEIHWHIIRGKYTAEQLLQAQSLQTVGGQTLKVETETLEINGKRQTLLYVNDVPVDYQGARRLLGETPVYPVGTNIAKVSNPPEGNSDAYNTYLAQALDGNWIIGEILYREYHLWSDGHRDEAPYAESSDNSHSGCREVFKRNPAKASQGYAGTYESQHICGSELRYAGSSHSAQHSPTGWWKISTTGISFEGTYFYQRDQFDFDERSRAGAKLCRNIYHVTGRGDDWYYGGEDLVIVGAYYETVYKLTKVSH
jgi:hypothetical protein